MSSTTWPRRVFIAAAVSWAFIFFQAAVSSTADWWLAVLNVAALIGTVLSGFWWAWTFRQARTYNPE
jgi:hypothetical protein